ncbi:MAG: hypothetical protein HYV06_05955 [Deltaproteobacteria bacterium]|nr:hypothetical protein [Deltaproteobacteria bacterium]
MTDAPIPPGCDTVVPIEEVENTTEGIRLTGGLKPGSHIRRRGEDVRADELGILALFMFVVILTGFFIMCATF